MEDGIKAKLAALEKEVSELRAKDGERENKVKFLEESLAHKTL